jgi:uncharacterized protein (TIGR03435 family)
MTNVTLKRCIMGACGVGPNQIFGGPQRLDSDHYEIVAKAEQPVDDDGVLMAMLQTLLAERFKLVIHRETKAVQALVLEVAKNDRSWRKPQVENRPPMVAEAGSMPKRSPWTASPKCCPVKWTCRFLRFSPPPSASF